MIISRTPLRVSLFGGGSDMPSFYEKDFGAVVSFPINKYVYVTMNKKFDKKVRVSYSETENVENVSELKHDLIRATLRKHNIEHGVEVTTISDIPGNGTGLGSSSALLVGLETIFQPNHKQNINAEYAFETETKNCLRVVGKQDHYGCAIGGMKYIEFHKRETTWVYFHPSDYMMNSFLMLWTGVSRSAATILSEQNSNIAKGSTRDIVRQLRDVAVDFRKEWKNGEMTIEYLGYLLNQNWELKKKMADGISNAKINQWYDQALLNGAYGGKLLGAGGGGFLLFIAPPEKHDQIQKAVGLEKINFELDMEGSTILYDDRKVTDAFRG